MASAYQYDLKLKSSEGHLVEIDTNAAYGYFLTPEGEEGGLWFDKTTVNGGGGGTTKLTLVDYNTVEELPMAVYATLRDHPMINIHADFRPQKYAP